MANTNPTDFQELLSGYLSDRLTEEQQAIFFEQLLQPMNQQLLEESIDSMAGETVGFSEELGPLRARSLAMLQQRIASTVEVLNDKKELQHMHEEDPQSFQRTPVKSIFPKKWMAAAAILALVAAGTWLWTNRETGSNRTVARTDSTHHDLEPGKDGAILVLADGRKVLLDSLQNGTVAQEKSTKLVLNNGQLSYQVTGSPEQAQSYNTVSTPIGRQIQLSLPDGTKAWLNAGSSLRFPTAFSGSNRMVTMTGEVYFDVARDALKPFIVQTSDQTTLEVLGTAFNINAYTNEPSINTTLAEGSVKLSHQQSSVILKPGQQGIVLPGQSTSELQVKDVDVSEIIAWKEGRFELYGNIKDIMRQLQRWYNISAVEYSGGTENRMLVATIARSKKLSEVLTILEKTGSVHFTIEGEKVIVKP